MSARKVLKIDYDGPEANAILARSASQWQAAHHHGMSTQGFPESCFELGRIVHRIPSLPENIPENSSSIDGYSTWKSSDVACSLQRKMEPSHTFHLRCSHPITCTMAASDNFHVWEGDVNNGVTLLVLAWAYILNASLAERQHLSLQYRRLPPDSAPGSMKLDLDYASPQERAWWKTIVTQGSYSIPASNLYSPWAVIVNGLNLDIIGKFDDNYCPPTASQAASYLARLCDIYGLGNQCSAALAAALSFPLHASSNRSKSVTIQLPPLLLSTRVASPRTRHQQYPADFSLLSRYMALSLSPSFYGATLWSVFVEPNVPCNFAGAWLGPIYSVLNSIIQGDKLEVLAKVLSSTNAAPLWLGLALCGRGAIINSIIPFLDQLRDYPHTHPVIDAAAWTNIPQSFMDIRPHGPYLQDGEVSRANVWRLRHDCYESYQDKEYSFFTTPHCGWPPFGIMQLKEIELELHDHLNCSHQWEYSFWTWLPCGTTDDGSGANKAISYPSQEPVFIQNFGTEAIKGTKYRNNDAASKAATKKIFQWSSSQVEEGFGACIVPRPYLPNSSLESTESEVLFDLKTRENIKNWLKMVPKDLFSPGSCNLKYTDNLK